MVGESSEPDENLFVFEGWHAIADDFGGVARSCGAYRGTDGLERRALGLGDRREVFVDGDRRFGRFGPFHAGMVRENG